PSSLFQILRSCSSSSSSSSYVAGHRQKSQIKLNTVTLGPAHHHDSLVLL
ncbi:unnamed protein product, partial [Rotaria magnacalcarata]